METRTVISKSKKKQPTNQGLQFTEMVVYKTALKHGKFESKTRHEIVK